MMLFIQNKPNDNDRGNSREILRLRLQDTVLARKRQNLASHFSQVLDQGSGGSQSKSGMTLIEIVIALGIVAFVYAYAYPQLTILTGMDEVERLARLSGDLKSMVDMAVLRKKPMRLTFDPSTNRYWLEEPTHQHQILIGEEFRPEEELTAEQFDEEFDSEYQALTGEPFTDPSGEREIKPISPVIAAKSFLKPGKWLKIDNLEWSNRSLGDQMTIRAFQVEPQNSVESIDFADPELRLSLVAFPDGYLQRALFHLGEDPERGYTVITLPLAGSAKIVVGHLDYDSALRNEEDAIE